MPRFGDRWVVDRTMFDFSMGGQCSCFACLSFMPDGTKGLIHAMSDLETDAANAEVSALSRSPWPPDMRDQVWSDRLKLRHLMKKKMSGYQQFWEQHSVELEEWCRAQGPLALKKIFQMPRTEIPERVKTDYGIHGAFGVVLSTVVEQVANFPATQLPTDARGDAEVAFEDALLFDRRGGFTLDIRKGEEIQEEVLQLWLQRMKTLGGPKLLDRAPKRVVQDEGDADEGLKPPSDHPDEDEPSEGPSFRSDRRIVRLLIARYWADQMIQKFLADRPKEEEVEKETSG